MDAPSGVPPAPSAVWAASTVAGVTRPVRILDPSGSCGPARPLADLPAGARQNGPACGHERAVYQRPLGVSTSSRTVVECKRPAISSFHERPATCHPPPHGEGADLAECSGTAPRVRDQPRPDPRAHGATGGGVLGAFGAPGPPCAGGLSLRGRGSRPAHGNCGCRPGHHLDDPVRARLVQPPTTNYRDVNRAHLADLLTERPVFSSKWTAAAATGSRSAGRG